jgi:hypothetical protein
MIKSIVLAFATIAATLGAGAAHAGGVSWSIGINTPVVGTVITNAPRYGHVYAAPYPVYAPVPVYAPAPVYVPAPPVVYYPRNVYYRPVPVVYPYRHPGWGRGHDGRWDGRHGGYHR